VVCGLWGTNPGLVYFFIWYIAKPVAATGLITVGIGGFCVSN